MKRVSSQKSEMTKKVRSQLVLLNKRRARNKYVINFVLTVVILDCTNANMCESGKFDQLQLHATGTGIHSTS